MMESLQKKVPVTSISPSGKEAFTTPVIPDKTAKRLQIKDSISWSACFAVVAGITGALLVYKIGVTISDLTAALFYLSLAGFGFFIARAILLYGSRETVHRHTKSPHLN